MLTRFQTLRRAGFVCSAAIAVAACATSKDNAGQPAAPKWSALASQVVGNAIYGECQPVESR